MSPPKRGFQKRGRRAGKAGDEAVTVLSIKSPASFDRMVSELSALLGPEGTTAATLRNALLADAIGVISQSINDGNLTTDERDSAMRKASDALRDGEWPKYFAQYADLLSLARQRDPNLRIDRRPLLHGGLQRLIISLARLEGVTADHVHHSKFVNYARSIVFGAVEANVLTNEEHVSAIQAVPPTWDALSVVYAELVDLIQQRDPAFLTRAVMKSAMTAEPIDEPGVDLVRMNFGTGRVIATEKTCE